MTGARVLDEVAEFVRRYVLLPSDAALVAVVLWIAHTLCLEAAEATPYLSVESPEKRSGKTRLLEVLELVVPRSLRASAASESALFRSIAEEPPPTLLFDELDALFRRPRAETEAVRGLLNAGHRRGAHTLRSIVKGKSIEVERFPVFCAKVLAGIGEPPDTISDRSIVIRMRRRAKGERVERFRYKRAVIEGHQLRERLAEWAALGCGNLESEPDVPVALDDRAADGWEPLLAIADAAGDTWPARARRAAVALSADRNDEDADSLGVRLLADVRSVFDGERMTTRALTAALVALEAAPWPDLRGKPLSQHVLSRMLSHYDVRSRSIKLADGTTAKGYLRHQFEDAWRRYCDGPTDDQNGADPHNPGFNSAPRHFGLLIGDLSDFQLDTEPHGADSENGEITTNHAGCAEVTSSNGHIGVPADNWRDEVPLDVDPDRLLEDAP